jgi:hypothetical protein
MVHWPGILEIVRSIRSVPCRLGKLNFGGVNMVRQIVFNDDVTWIVRIPMPRRIIANDGGFTIETVDEYWTDEHAREMQKEVFTMMYIRDHSDIHVPEIFDFNVTANNSLGASYILMECVHGNSIMDLAAEVPEHHIEKPHAAIAKFQVLLPMFSFNICSCNCQPSTSIKLER